MEVLRRPELVGRPLIVGGRGDPTERGVVSTASYEARAFGVRSGMPLRVAVRRCPEADVPEDVAQRIQRDVLAATNLHCSVGIGDTKVRAKIATEFGKPRGMFRLTRDTWFEVMGDRPTEDLWGVGPRISQRLAGLGIETVRQFAEAEDALLAGEFGPGMGPYLAGLGRGEGSATVDDRPWVARAHGRETTCQQDLAAGEVQEALRALAAQVVDDIDAEGRACARVHLKVRFAPFFTVNRSRKLATPTSDAGVVADTALDLYQRLADERPVRLLGIRAEMAPPEGGYDAPRTHGRRGIP